MNYYNDNDPNSAATLRELIRRGLISNGIVDDRSILDVQPDDLRGFTQCHFFAGAGVWSYALRLAGWRDDWPVWTGSPPCQPFSVAGKQDGKDDARHLAPKFASLVGACRPAVLFGEQVASAAVFGPSAKGNRPGFEGTPPWAWLDDLFDRLEAAHYAVGANDVPNAGVGAPHIRQRTYFGAIRLADLYSDRRDQGRFGLPEAGCHGLVGNGSIGGLADGLGAGLEEHSRDGDDRDQSGRVRAHQVGPASSGGESDWLENSHSPIPEQLARGWAGPGKAPGIGTHGQSDGRSELVEEQSSAGPTNGFWRDADWLYCRDGQWRPVEPCIQQMADGSAGSLGRLRDSSIREVEAAVEAWAERHKRDAADSVRELWDTLSSDEIVERSDGGFDSVQEAPFLLAFLRQLTDQGWRFSIGDERSGSEASGRFLRILRFDTQPSYSSRGRGLDEQRPGEFTDPLRELSQVLAYHTEVCWGLSGWKNGGAFPLEVNARSRTGRLRLYGNAINPWPAKAYIEAFCEAVGIPLSGNGVASSGLTNHF